MDWPYTEKSEIFHIRLSKHSKDIKNSEGISGCEHIKYIFEDHGKSTETKHLGKIKSVSTDTLKVRLKLREKSWIKTEASAAMSHPRVELNQQQVQSALFILLLCSASRESLVPKFVNWKDKIFQIQKD